MFNFAKTTSKQVVWWDEAALGGLASETYNREQTTLLQLLMVARKKQHFYIFVIPKYYRLKEGIIERAICLLHVFSHDKITRGRYCYYSKDGLNNMYRHWKSSKHPGYKEFYMYPGTFAENLPLVIDEKLYDEKKDIAILSIGKTNDPMNARLKKKDDELNKLRRTIGNLNFTDYKNIAKLFNISTKTLRKWREMPNEDSKEVINKDIKESDKKK
jgi:hypothetical protein